VTSSDPQHLYGVIIDATFPYKTNNERYICSLKIVDQSLYVKSQKGSGDSSDYATLVLYAKRFEDLPIVTRLGDIIRVHRATLRLYNGTRQFNANIFYNSSWALFSGDSNENSATHFSGKHYSFEKSEASTLANTRKWASQYFSQYNVLSDNMYTTLAKASAQKGDFDVVARISQVFELDEYTNELRLRDAGAGASWNVLALKMKFPNVKVGDVVRIRSVTYDETSTQKKVLLLSHYSNILTFPAGSKLAKEIRGKAADEKVDRAAITGSSATVLTEVDKKWANLPVHSLQDLFHNVESDKELQSKDTFRTQFYVTRIEAANVQEWTKSLDKKTKKSSSFKGQKGNANAIYQVQFLVKDVSTQFNNNTYRVLLYTHDGLGANFFNTPADNLYSNDKARKKLEEYGAVLTKFNSFVDAVVERRNGYYFIKDTRIAF
jgi:hypothetical protein